MFTGIIEELGVVESAGARLHIRCATVLEDAFAGASIAVNGVCLTAAALYPEGFAADVSAETLRRSTLGQLERGDLVNLERPLKASGRLGGHLVQGHVDGVGEIVALERLRGGDWRLQLRVPQTLDRYIVLKGSIAVDGVSLTVAAIEESLVSVSLIPHTYANTAFRARRAGSRVNIECDILAKYVERLLARRSPAPGLTEEQLREWGY